MEISWYTKRVKDYLEGSLSQQELSTFEQFMSEHSEFIEYVNAYKEIILNSDIPEEIDPNIVEKPLNVNFHKEEHTHHTPPKEKIEAEINAIDASPIEVPLNAPLVERIEKLHVESELPRTSQTKPVLVEQENELYASGGSASAAIAPPSEERPPREKSKMLYYVLGIPILLLSLLLLSQIITHNKSIAQKESPEKLAEEMFSKTSNQLLWFKEFEDKALFQDLNNLVNSIITQYEENEDYIETLGLLEQLEEIKDNVEYDYDQPERNKLNLEQIKNAVTISKGLCYIKTGSIEKAEINLEDLAWGSSNKKKRGEEQGFIKDTLELENQAAWCLAAIYLKNNKIDIARELLEKLQQGDNGTYKEDASLVLNRLNS